MGEEAKAYTRWCSDLEDALVTARTLDLLGFKWSMRPKNHEETYSQVQPREVKPLRWPPFYRAVRLWETKTRTTPGYELTYSLKSDEDVSWIAGRAHRHISECK